MRGGLTFTRGPVGPDTEVLKEERREASQGWKKRKEDEKRKKMEGRDGKDKKGSVGERLRRVLSGGSDGGRKN